VCFGFSPLVYFQRLFFFFLLICLERCTGPETRCKSTNNNTQEVAGLNTASAGRSFGGAYCAGKFCAGNGRRPVQGLGRSGVVVRQLAWAVRFGFEAARSQCLCQQNLRHGCYGSMIGPRYCSDRATKLRRQVSEN
jgi:hypothetical protein